MLVVGALWTSGVARVIDTSLRYTVDKTTREILFLPLPADVKYRAKPFIDVTVDRLSKGAGALMILVLIKDWGLALTWQQLSYASLTIMALWVFFALRARAEYMEAFRRSIVQQDMKVGEIRLETADLSTIEALVEELAHPEAKRVIYALDLLESLDKRHLVSPLMLYHEHPDVRVRVLRLAEATGRIGADRWMRGIERCLIDHEGEVRGAAVRALASVKGQEAAALMRPYLDDADPALVVTAASALSNSTEETDRDHAAEAFRKLIDDSREQRAHTRAEVARALGRVTNPAFRPLLVPLMFDADVDVARDAIRSAARLGAGDFLFVPPLVSLLRNRLLKGAARDVLAGYGEEVVPTLVYFMKDREEDQWVRRHIPATLARIPCQASLQALLGALEDSDGFLRYKALSAVEQLRRNQPDLVVPPATIEKLIFSETGRAFDRLTLHYNLFETGGLDKDCLLARGLTEKYERAYNRVFTLLSLVHPADDIAAVRHALTSTDSRARSSAAEFLDNILRGDARHRVMLLAEDMPLAERVRKGNALFRTRQRDVEDTLAQLIHDENQEVAATAIQVVEARKLWSLAGDLEHVLEHRSPKDWWVFEAASWAAAAQRMPAERRRVLWQEPLPAVELADRLRRIRLFDFVSVDELFRVASLGRQVRHEAGRALAQEGQPADYAALRARRPGGDAARTRRPRRADRAGRDQLRGSARRASGAPDGDGARAGDHAHDDHRGVPDAGGRERRDRPGHLPAAARDPLRTGVAHGGARRADAGVAAARRRRRAGARRPDPAAVQPAAPARDLGGAGPAGRDRQGGAAGRRQHGLQARRHGGHSRGAHRPVGGRRRRRGSRPRRGRRRGRHLRGAERPVHDLARAR